MATARALANTAAQTLFTVPLHSKGKITSINIDNPTAATITVRIQDVITTTASIVATTGVAVAGAVQAPIFRYQVEVAATSTVDVPEDELRDTEFLGVVSAIVDATAATCVIIVSYHLE